MKVTAWRNGRFGNASCAFGIRIGEKNRDRYFREEWESVTIEIEDGPAVEAPISDGFWRKCPEVKHREFRDWFTSKHWIPWPGGHPPMFELEPADERRFKLSGPHHER